MRTSLNRPGNHKGFPDLVQQLENKLASIKARENKITEKINSQLLPLKKQRHIFEKAIENVKNLGDKDFVFSRIQIAAVGHNLPE